MLTQLFFLVGISIPLALAWGFGRAKPDWSKRKVALWSAAPIPAIAMIPSLVLAVYDATAAPENCGTDACETEMEVGLVLLAVTGATFIIGLLLAFGTVAVVRWITPSKAGSDLFQ